MGIPNYKDIMDLVKKGLTIEAQEKIMELREAAITLQEENLQLRGRIGELEAQIKRTRDLKLEGGVYWLAEESVPLCQFCYDKDGKLIHLQSGGNEWTHEWRCRACNHVFGKRISPDSFGFQGSDEPFSSM